MKYTQEYLEVLANQFKILGDKTRLSILMLLREEGELPVNQIVDQLDTTQANISKHLKILYSYNLVKKRQLKSSVLYSVKKDCIFDICEILTLSSKDPKDHIIIDNED